MLKFVNYFYPPCIILCFILSRSTSFNRAPQAMTSSAKILSSSTMATSYTHGPLRELLVHLLACMLLVNLVAVYRCRKLQQSAFANLTR